MKDSHAGLAAKLVQVMKNVSGLKKDGRNTHHKFEFVSHDNVVNHVRDAMAEAGIGFTSEVMDVREMGKNVLAQVRYTLTDVETGEVKECSFYGMGSDSQDKALYKAVTQAKKMFLLNTFLIPTGDQYADGDYGHGDQYADGDYGHGYEKPTRREQPRQAAATRARPVPSKPAAVDTAEDHARGLKAIWAKASEFWTTGTGEKDKSKNPVYCWLAEIGYALPNGSDGQPSLSSCSVEQLRDIYKRLSTRVDEAKKLAAASGLQKQKASA